MGDSEIDTLLAKLAATSRRRVPLPLLSGTRRFELGRRLGGGGFGDVYEARDREHGTMVALKALKSAQPAWIYRFKREFRAVSDLAHPNIVRLYELFCEDDQWYLTMELIDGLPFDQYVARAPDQLGPCFAQLALGLAELHRAGCLHRDVKPSNALVEASGRLVLLDFGLTVQTHALLQTVVAGTPPYMAPELATGGEPTQGSDWYAFGVMLYEALAGERPWQGTSAEIMGGKLAGNPPIPSDLIPGADPTLESLAMRLLAPVPAERPGTDEILAELAVAPRARRAAGRRVDEVSAMVGRERELAVLEQALAIAIDERAALVTVHGQPGMGKTSLLGAFAAAVRDRGVQVYEGRCHETEALPYKGMDGVIDALCNELSYRPRDAVADLVTAGAGALVQMFPVFKRVAAFAGARRHRSPAASAHDTRREAVQALRELWTRMAALAPVVVIIDDLQWASDDSASLLLELLAVPAPPVLAIVAYRRDGAGAAPMLDRFLAGLPALRGLEQLEVAVDALDEEAIGQLLAARPGLSSSPAQALHETGGHPYLLSRLLDSDWAGEHALDLSALLSAQLAGLDPDARQLLEVVAIAGAPVGQAAAFAAAGLRRDPALIDELRRHKLIQRLAATPEAPVEAYHDRVREIAVAELGEARRRELHGRLAVALEGGGVLEPDILASHYRQARNTEKALEWTRRAARNAAASLAFARANELYLDLIELDLTGPERIAVLEDLAEAQVQSGRRNDAGLTCIVAAEIAGRLADPVRQAALRARAGEHLLLGGQLERGLQLIRGALAGFAVSLPADDATAVALSFNLGAELATRGLEFRRRPAQDVPPDLLRRLDLELAVARALLLTDLRSPLMASYALRDALEAGDPQRLQRALAYFVLSNSARAPGHALVVAAEERARELAVELGDDVALGWSALAEGIRAIQRSEFERALEALAEAERRFTANGAAFAREAAIARIGTLVVCGSLGVDIPYARRSHARCTEEAVSRGDVFAATWAGTILCWIELAGGDPERARMRLEEGRNAWPRVADSLFATVSVLNELAIAVYEDPARSWDVVERVQPDFQRLFSSLMPMPRLVYGRLAAAAAMGAFHAGRADRAETIARIEPLLVNVVQVTHERSTQHVLQGHLCTLGGDAAGAAAELEQAAAGWGRSHRRGPELSVRLRLRQLAGDADGAARVAAQLRDFTVAEPERFAVLYCGPYPPGDS